jgi:hypothetical protein
MNDKVSLEGNFITFFEDVNKEGFTMGGIHPHNKCIRKDTILAYDIYDIESGRSESVIRIITDNDILCILYSTRERGNRVFDFIHEVMTDN